MQLPRAGAEGAERSSIGSSLSTGYVDLYWLPLGAGGWFVRFNGRVYEAAKARLAGRRPLDLYHCALEVRVPEGRFVIELTPIPDAHGVRRGVTVEGPVGSRWLSRLRTFRYELRCWPDGIIPDVAEAVDVPQRLTAHPWQARRLLELVPSTPRLVWGRDELGASEMWNSNSVIAWLLARSGLLDGCVGPPPGGRAPGWDAGVLLAGRQAASESEPSLHLLDGTV